MKRHHEGERRKTMLQVTTDDETFAFTVTRHAAKPSSSLDFLKFNFLLLTFYIYIQMYLEWWKFHLNTAYAHV